MKNIIFFALVLISFQSSFAQQALFDDEKVVTLKFIDLVKNRDVDQLKELVSYPLRREYPLADIETPTEFVERYDEVFDDSLVQIIAQSDIDTHWERFGTKGVHINGGLLWLYEDGTLKTVNYQSDWEKNRIQELIAEDKANIHESINEYFSPTLVIETQKFRVRIDWVDGQKYRYASWSIDKDMSEKPDLILTQGEFDKDGSGGNHYFEFKNGIYHYICYVKPRRKNGTPPALLVVTKKGKTILKQGATLLKN